MYICKYMHTCIVHACRLVYMACTCIVHALDRFMWPVHVHTYVCMYVNAHMHVNRFIWPVHVCTCTYI